MIPNPNCYLFAAPSTKIDAILNWANMCFPEAHHPHKTELLSLIEEANESAAHELGEADAIAWADGFKIPNSVVLSHVACLRAAQLDFTKMIERRLKTVQHKRLNLDRVEELRTDNPEKILMRDLAGGMRVFLPDGFVPNGLTDKSLLRDTYLKVAPAVDKMLYGIIEDGLAFVLPLEIALQHIPRLHFCKAHWTSKKGKPSGRPLGDLTFVEGTPLNTPETAVMASEYYGPIIHPSITDIVAMIAQYMETYIAADPGRCTDDVVIWKMDLKGAYTLLSFRPEDTGLFAMRLTDNLVYLQFVGIFGWAGTPAAFQVVTRAICWELKHALSGLCTMYVDDIIGVCTTDALESELKIARNVCTRLLGPGAVADDKTESGRRIDVIGFTIDLNLDRVLISRKNHLKALHGFLNVDIDGKLSLREAQKYASWSSRYGLICRVMRPFCNALHRLTAGRTSAHAKFNLSAEARITVQCWRALLCIIPYDEIQLTRTISSFKLTPATVVAEFDASLAGIGIVWFDVQEGTEIAMGVCALSTEALAFKDDSSYQNLSEFIAAIVAVLGFIRLGYTGKNLLLRGDSITALQWAINERTKGSIVTRAAIVWTVLCIAADVHVTDVTHIAGVDNKICDQLSRRCATTKKSVREEAKDLGLGCAKVLAFDSDSTVSDLIQLCDPRESFDTDASFSTFWGEVRAVVMRALLK